MSHSEKDLNRKQITIPAVRQRALLSAFNGKNLDEEKFGNTNIQAALRQLQHRLVSFKNNSIEKSTNENNHSNENDHI